MLERLERTSHLRRSTDALPGLKIQLHVVHQGPCFSYLPPRYTSAKQVHPKSLSSMVVDKANTSPFEMESSDHHFIISQTVQERRRENFGTAYYPGFSRESHRRLCQFHSPQGRGQQLQRLAPTWVSHKGFRGNEDLALAHTHVLGYTSSPENEEIVVGEKFRASVQNRLYGI